MTLHDKLQKMRGEIRSAYKSEDTEEFFDRVFTKPLGYLWALLFMRLRWTPNMVTILSMVIGVAGGAMFYQTAFGWNLAGVLLLIWANILDSTDGQMARLTHKSSTLGRILDALSTSVWYVAIYIALCLRLQGARIPFTQNTQWGLWIWLVALVSSCLGHQRQCMIADYLRNIHLFFLKGKKGSELDSAADIRQKRLALPKKCWFQRLYLFFYGLYTRAQEAATPWFQRFYAALREKYGEEIPPELRAELLAQSRRYIQLTNVLTFNARAYTLFACMLLGVPALYFPLEFIPFNLLLWFTRARYERIFRRLYYKYQLPGSENKPPRRKIYTAVFFLLGVAGIAFMLSRMDLTHIEWNAVLRYLPVWIPALLLIWAVIYLLHTLAYRLTLGESGKKVKLLYLYKITVSCFAINHVTPVGLIGGEPYRILELKQYVGTAKATASTVTFSVLFIMSHVMFWLTGSALYFALFGLGGGVFRTTLMGVICLAAACMTALFLFARREGLIERLFGAFSRLPLIGKPAARFLQKNLETVRRVDHEISAFHAQRWRFWLAIGMEYATRLLEASEYLLIFSLLGASINFAESIFSLTCASLLGNLMFFMPLQVGAREGGLAIALDWLQEASSFGVTASLLARFREIVYIVLGIVMLLVKGGEASERLRKGSL